MVENYNTYSTSFRIRSYEVGTDQKTSISTIANLFQESAGLHAKKLNFDITDLHGLGLTWVLYKMHIKVFEFPSRWDDVWVKTWPSTGKDIRAFRSYEMTDEGGKLFAKALGQWMTLDLKSRRPAKIPDQLLRFPQLHQKGEAMNADKKPIAPLKPDSLNFITTVSEYDLDMNNHVNSVKYIEWSTGYQKKSRLLRCREVLIQYQAEARYGDSIYLSCENSENSENSEKITLYNKDEKALSTAIISYD